MWRKTVLDVIVGLKLEIDQNFTAGRMIGSLIQYIQVILAIIVQTNTKKKLHRVLKWEAQKKTILYAEYENMRLDKK